MLRNETSPFDNEPDEKLDFDDVTVLALMVIGALVLISVFWLGAFCATHRLEAALLTL